MLEYLLALLYNLCSNTACGFLLCLSHSCQYLRWCLWTYRSVIITFLFPIVIIFLFMISAFVLQLFQMRQYLMRAFVGRSADFKNRCLWLLSTLWDCQGRLFHGYEIVGMEKLPRDGPVLIIYYHGTIPIDVYYFVARYFLKREKLPVAIVDRFLFYIPGLRNLLEFLNATPGSVESCTKSLKQNKVILISPGGVREALFADEFYSIIWGSRVGFAKVAYNAGIPVYPMFTENCRDAVRVVQYGKSWFRKLYEKTRLPIALIYGYFPVKLRTFIGDPIYPDSSISLEEYAQMVRQSVECLVDSHQIQPGNIFRGLLQRMPSLDRYLHQTASRARHKTKKISAQDSTRDDGDQHKAKDEFDASSQIKQCSF